MVGLPTSPLGLVLLAGVTGGGLLALGFALREVGAIRQVIGGTSTDIYSLSTGTNGPISISGTAVLYEETLLSPFTGTDCLALEYEVEERRTTQHGTSWVEIDSGRAAVPFLLEDKTGSVLVKPTRVRLGLDTSETIDVDGGEPPPDRIQEFIERNADVDSEERTWDLKIVELNVGDDRRYIERRLDSGESVTVFGEVRNEPGVSTRAGQVNAVLAAGSHPLVLSETTPYRTVLRVFWPVLVAACLGIVLLGAAIALVLL
ncbi:GIDE domain-containing protein [Salinirubellus sp. GCM10025818]|uniref:GIDE domain-containing protein n=1 Tax=Salinirubellus TaxID=2162630 RepID=UPI0030D05F3E